MLQKKIFGDKLYKDLHSVIFKYLSINDQKAVCLLLGCKLAFNITRYCIKNKYINLYNYLVNHKIVVMNITTYIEVGKYGTIEFIKYLDRMGCFINYGVIYSSILHKNIDVLKHLINIGFKISPLAKELILIVNDDKIYDLVSDIESITMLKNIRKNHYSNEIHYVTTDCGITAQKMYKEYLIETNRL